ncbi:MAG: SPOR domain-containing protein [Pseudomonadota bacterium]|nr:hypothetical protein [Pseudomonadales bacterium]MDY6921530.1 SPOR domain-containing protein [Pseudomonadota bacterium]
MSKSDAIPAWVWLFTGVVTGLFLAFLYYLAGIKPTDQELKEMAVKIAPDTGSGRAKPKFDFYTLLPDHEVVAPTPEATTPGKPGKPAPVPSPEQQYVIQTGSFRSAQEADHRRAELILMGLDVNIEKVELDPGEAWHRVQVGPFASPQALEQAKSTLAEHDIEHIVLRLKK